MTLANPSYKEIPDVFVENTGIKASQGKKKTRP